MNILYCGDQGIKDGLLVSILSLIKHVKEPLNIYILTIDYQNSKPITAKTTKLLDELVKKQNKNSFVKTIDGTEAFKKRLPKANMKSYFTPCSMLRLYLDEIKELPKDRLLYLDYDVVCRQDPADFYHTNLENIEAAGVLDIYGKHFYRYNFPKRDYMNSGVLLFNMAECEKSQIFTRAVQLCQKRRMMLADQAALNKVIKKRKLMPRKFNEQQDHPKEDTVFHHFSNNFKFWPIFHVQKVKPFEVEKIHKTLKIHEYDDILDEYQKLKNSL